MLEDLLPHYENELTILRKLSKDFARRYPKIAGRLMLEGEVCEDPHVERLIESFAFLTARIHRKLDDELPEVTEALLSVLYPHFLRPVPSMSIVQLAAAPGAGLSSRQPIPRGTQLLSRPVNGMPVKYRTAYDVEVWPVSVVDARLEALERSAFVARSATAVASLRIRVQADAGIVIGALGIDRLRFYIDGESPVVHALYELLMNSVERVTLLAPDNARIAPLELPASVIRSVGFGSDEALLDHDPRSFLGYQLIQEYFVLPEKFLFFEVSGLELSRFKNAVDLVFTIKPFGRPERLARLEQTVGAETFRLHCTPIVNLFKQLAEPVQITQERHEYPVIPDVRRPLGLEVYSIDSVRKFSRSREREAIVEFQPFYSIKHGVEGEDAANHYWLARRDASTLPNDEGTQMTIALVDRSMTPNTPAVETLSLSLTCTNRDLPASLPFGGSDSALQVEEGGAISIARLLKKPTATWRAPMRLANQWRLISHLALNHLSIVNGGREALLEILSLYNYADSASLRKQIAGIVDVRSQPSVTRIGTAPRMAFVRGTDIELTFDEDQYVGSGIYLLARVLDLFFGLYCTGNSYTRLSLRSRQREEPITQFAPRAGALHLI
ncbi:MAG: hypothetical protein JWQ90_4765 [Hydrocarboniphaga sp.]|uniref:type VI secretion system baseplate subunit TssF n=1 Tax=Hydrocarboniphaga sp. TaxID=2033016 RepID=UPI0026253FE7|nr:type VI secretion system baseplate subunit TssF [Hydrocarboniphaga sp.]MDB5972315.1 hypothetical protein [Hydrocarboniphaga sp.]